MSRRKRGGIRDLLECAGLLSVATFFRVLPSPLAYRVGGAIGLLAFRVDRRHRTVAVENIRAAYEGKLTEDEVRTLAREVFRNLGWTAVEICRLNRITPQTAPRYITMDGYDHVERVQAEGRGVIFVPIHSGCWEILPVSTALWGNPASSLGRPLDNPYLDFLLNRLRTRFGGEVVSKRNAVPELLKILRRGGGVGILIDQNVAREEGVFVEFFGRPACTTVTPALLALRTGAALLPAAAIREGKDRHRVVVCPEVPPVRTGDLTRDLQVTTAALSRALEGIIRQHPEQWFWVHRRWKTQPLSPTGDAP